MMIQDAINELAEMAVKKKDEYIKARLNEMGCGPEYLRFHQYDIIPVQYACKDNSATLVCVVNAAEERELFWFVELLYQVFRQGRDSYEVDFVPYDASRVDDETHQDAMETAIKARRQALERREGAHDTGYTVCGGCNSYDNEAD